MARGLCPMHCAFTHSRFLVPFAGGESASGGGSPGRGVLGEGGLIRSYCRGPDGQVTRDLTPTQMEGAVASAGGLLWIDLEGSDPAEARGVLDDVFHFHHLAVDDCLNPHIDP